MWFWICTVVAMPFTALGYWLHEIGVMFIYVEEVNSHHLFDVSGFVDLLSVPTILIGWIFGALLLYQVWKVIPPDIARTTPGKAVGFSFIPFFGLYWIFVAYKGLSEDMNKTFQQQGIYYQVDRYLELLLCIALILNYTYLDVGLTAAFAEIFFFKSVKDGAIILLEQGERHQRF